MNSMYLEYLCEKYSWDKMVADLDNPWANPNQYDWANKPKEKKKKCECGLDDKEGRHHYSYCPLYKKDLA